MEHKYLWERARLALTRLKIAFEEPPDKGRDMTAQLAMHVAIEEFSAYLHFQAGVARRAEKVLEWQPDESCDCSHFVPPAAASADAEENVLWPATKN